MVGFIFGILVFIAGIALCIICANYTKSESVVCLDESGNTVFESYGKPKCITKEVKAWRKYSLISLIACSAVSIFLIFLGCCSTVETGTTGVVTTFGRVEDYTYEAGFHLKAPWTSVTRMDNRVQRSTVELSCFSSDIQEVNMRYTLNYQIDKANAQEIYKSIGKNYYDTVIEPTISECVKVATARFTAEQLVQTRSNLAKEIELLLVAKLSEYHINVASTAIEDMDFTDAFTNAVEAKQVAEQKKKQAAIEYAQALEKAENEKEIALRNAEIAKTQAEASAIQAKIKAEADAEVAQIQARADMEVQKIGADAAAYAGQKEGSVAMQRLAAINGWTVVINEINGVSELHKTDGTLVTEAERAEGVKRLIEYYYTQSWNGQLPDTLISDGSISSVIIGN